MRLYIRRLLLPLCITSFLVACTTLSKEQCAADKWYEIGEVDGLRGENMKLFEKHVKACKNHNITPDLASYKKGRAVGHKSYCTVQHQVDLGVEGKKYNDICSGKMVALLKEANDWGYLYHETKRALQKTEYDLSSIRSKLDDKNLKEKEEYRLKDAEERLQNEVDRVRRELIRLKLVGETILTQKARSM